MENALTYMKQIKSYSVHMCPATPTTADVMTENNVRLEQFGFYLDENVPIEETFTSIQSAQSAVSTISSLGITYSIRVDALTFSPYLINMCLDLKCLTHLNITCDNFTDDTQLLLVEIINNLTMLKSLEFKNLYICDIEPLRDSMYNWLDVDYDHLSSQQSSFKGYILHLKDMSSLCIYLLYVFTLFLLIHNIPYYIIVANKNDSKNTCFIIDYLQCVDK